MNLLSRRVADMVAIVALTSASVLLQASVSRATETDSDTCIAGYEWREAVPGDHVCVIPEIRMQTAGDNRLAEFRHQPGNPDACLDGYVWRLAVPNDHVCVDPWIQGQVWRDNIWAPARVACHASTSVPDGRDVPKSAVRCSPSGYWRATIEASAQQYWMLGSDAGIEVTVEHYVDGNWVQQPAQSIDVNRAVCIGPSDVNTTCWVNVNAYYPCENRGQSELECKNTSWSSSEYRGVRGSGFVVFGDGSGINLPFVSDWSVQESQPQ